LHWLPLPLNRQIAPHARTGLVVELPALLVGGATFPDMLSPTKLKLSALDPDANAGARSDKVVPLHPETDETTPMNFLVVKSLMRFVTLIKQATTWSFCNEAWNR
jgi:hypothetical protein